MVQEMPQGVDADLAMKCASATGRQIALELGQSQRAAPGAIDDLDHHVHLFQPGD